MLGPALGDLLYQGLEEVVHLALEPEHRSIVAVDVESFSTRRNPVQLRIREYLTGTLADLLRRIGATEGHYATQDTGDGYLISISLAVPIVRVLDQFVPELARRLRAHNHAVPDDERLRLRVAVHAANVLADPLPMHGEAVIRTCRMLDSPAVRACLAATAQPLAVIASREVYEDVVEHGDASVDPAAWHQVIAEVNHTREVAWAHVPADSDAPLRARVVIGRGDRHAAPAPVPQGSQAPDDRISATALLEITDRFLQVEAIADEGVRRQVLSLLPREISAVIPHHAVGKAHVVGIVRTCLNYPGALKELLEVLQGFEGDSLPMRRLRAAVARVPTEPPI